MTSMQRSSLATHALPLCQILQWCTTGVSCRTIIHPILNIVYVPLKGMLRFLFD